MKNYSELSFSDDFMFYSVLTLNPDLLKELLERILDMEIAEIQLLEGQKTMEYCYTGKGIRLDLYAKTTDGKVFNVEMQTSGEKEIPRRMRYYQGMLDVNLLKKAGDYTKIEDSYIIFICLHDPFGNNLPVYTFKNICTENNGILLEDGTSKVVVNVSGDKSKASKKLIPLLEYFESNATKDDFTGKLENEVTRIKGLEERRNLYMLYEINLAKAREEGRAEMQAEMEAKLAEMEAKLAEKEAKLAEREAEMEAKLAEKEAEIKKLKAVSNK